LRKVRKPAFIKNPVAEQQNTNSAARFSRS